MDEKEREERLARYGAVPAEMRDERRWVCYVLVNRGGKDTKVPVCPDGSPARSNDPSTWRSFEECALSPLRNSAGIGFVLGSGWAGVDLDDMDMAVCDEFVSTLGSYAEVSRSGKGIHVIGRGTLPSGRRRKGGVEMYDGGRFFVVTGNPWRDEILPIRDITAPLESLWRKWLADEAEVKQTAQSIRVDYSLSNDDPASSMQERLDIARRSRQGERFSMLFDRGDWANAGYSSQSEADMALCSMLAFWLDRKPELVDTAFRVSALYRPKWDECHFTDRGGKETYGERTIATACASGETFGAGDRPSEAPAKEEYPLTDTGNGMRFADRYGSDLRYDNTRKAWMLWDGSCWTLDTTQRARGMADRLVADMAIEARAEPLEERRKALERNAIRTAMTTGKEAMLKEAQHMGDIPAVTEDFDRDPWLLNCRNGVVDLRTGELRMHERSLMLSKRTAVDVDMDGDCPTWRKALMDIFLQDEGMVDYIQRCVGYTLTGDTREQCFFECYGSGSNGKSLFLNTLQRIMGSYALNAQVESILTRGSNSGGGASSEIARMNGARFVRTNEPSEGSRFNEGLVKQLTGGDVVTARFLYANEFEFTPVFKLWIATNAQIIVRGTDRGIWRRIRLIPFEAVFDGANEDKTLERRLQEELPAILGWAVKGCLKWQRDGLESPEKVRKAVEGYQADMDVVKKFIDDMVETSNPTAFTQAYAVYSRYKDWAQKGNEYVMSQTKFGREFSKRFPKFKKDGRTYYSGMSLVPITLYV